MKYKWSPEQISRVTEMKASGYTLSQIAAEFKTTIGAIAGLVFRIKHPTLFEPRKQYTPRHKMSPAKASEIDAAIRAPENASVGSKQLSERLGVTRYYIRNARRDAGIVVSKKKPSSRSPSRNRRRAFGWGTHKGATQKKRDLPTYGHWEAIFYGSKTLLETGPNDCMWPLGEFDSTPTHYCGKPRQADRAYCPRHCKLAYVPPETDIEVWGYST